MTPGITWPLLVLCKIRSVCSLVTAYLKNRSEDFSETWYEVGSQKYKNHHTAVFFYKKSRFLENRSFMQKYAIFSHFLQFLGLCEKTVPMIFFKFCQNVTENFIYYIHRIIFSPVKYKFCPFIFPILAQNIEVRGQIWRHFELSFRVREGLLGGGDLLKSLG